MVKSIKIRNVKDVEKVNSIVSKYPFDIWIHGKSGNADAKSILGMFILRLDEPLTIVTPDDVDCSRLFSELDEYFQIF